MILALAVMTIFGLIACALLYAKKVQAKDLSNQLFEKQEVSSQLRNEKHHEWERSNILQDEVYALRQEIDGLNASFKNMLAENEEELGFGHHVKWRSHRKPTSETYRIHFDMEPNGQRILEELTMRFKRGIYTDDERETCRRIGRSEVVDFIINRINTANDSKYSEHLELAHMEQYND